MNWRQVFTALELNRVTHQGSKDDWWASSPFTEDKTASFHCNDKGWYCQSSKQGGGPLELVQLVQEVRTGIKPNIYQAAAWLVYKGLSHFSGHSRSVPAKLDSREVPNNVADKPLPANQPIRQNLIPLLQTNHPCLIQRGISAETALQLRCGFLPGSSSPLAERLVFQVRGVVEQDGQIITPILSHLGRATTDAQAREHGKWWLYKGFHKKLELYHLDRLLTDPDTIKQAKQAGQILLVEGCLDVAKLVEAKLCNCVASFGAHLHQEQITKLELIKSRLGIDQLTILYDRDSTGTRASQEVSDKLSKAGWRVRIFDWEQDFSNSLGQTTQMPTQISDPADLSIEQLKWLRIRGLI